MNTRMRVVLSVVALGASPLAGTAALAQPAPAAPATSASTPSKANGHAGFLKSVQGDVRLQPAGGAERSAQSGDRVAPSDRLLTGPNGSASLVLRDGTAIVVGPASQLDLKSFRYDSTTQEGGLWIGLLRGSLRMVTGLIGKAHPEAVRIETQTATIGIRGTDFIVQADAAQ